MQAILCPRGQYNLKLLNCQIGVHALHITARCSEKHNTGSLKSRSNRTIGPNVNNKEHLVFSKTGFIILVIRNAFI